MHIPPDANEMACAVCDQPLMAVMRGSEIVEWRHVGDAPDAPPNERPDHRPQPAPRTEVATEERCDFCMGPKPIWVLPVGQFEFSGQFGIADTWVCCEVCARLLRKGRWPEVTRRGLRAVAAKYAISPAEPRLVAEIEALHVQVRDHIQGPVRRRDYFQT